MATGGIARTELSDSESFDTLPVSDSSYSTEEECRPQKRIWSWDDEHYHRMGNLLEIGFLSDVILEVGPEKVPVKAHRLLLQAGSPDLCEKIKALNNDPNSVLPIPGVDFDSFILFLKFLYTGNTGSELEGLSFLPLLKIATDYQVTTLADICANKAERCLSEKNVLCIFQQAMECGHKPLTNSSLIFICKHAWKIVDSNGFNELRQECLYEILKRDDLQVQSELHLFEAVVRWAHAECIRSGREPGDWDNIRSTMAKVIGLIRFPVMNQAEFTLHVALKNFLSLDELVKILLYFTVPSAEREKIPPGRFISTPRHYYKAGTNFSASHGESDESSERANFSPSGEEPSKQMKELAEIMEKTPNTNVKDNHTPKATKRYTDKRHLFQ